MEQATPLTPEQRYHANWRLAYKAVMMFPMKLWIDNKEDLLQQARLGLWKACLNYDESLGWQFSTLAMTIMRRQVMHYIHQKQLLIRPPQPNTGRKDKAGYDKSWQAWRWIKKCVVVVEDLNNLPELTERRERKKEEAQRLYDDVMECLMGLEGRDGKIVRMNVLEGMSLTKISKRYGFTKERARQLVNRGLRKRVHYWMVKRHDWCFCLDCQESRRFSLNNRVE